MPTEIKDMRERFGGEKYNKRAINKHSIRVYEHKGLFYKMDKTLDGTPPFFILTRLDDDPRERASMGQKLQVEGQKIWGDGYTWGQAEKAAFLVIENFVPIQPATV